MDEREAAVTEKFYKGGSTIELTCRVERVVGQRPEYIIWHHEDRMLNYDTERGGIRYTCSYIHTHGINPMLGWGLFGSLLSSVMSVIIKIMGLYS